MARKTVLIVGASSGIGFATAKNLAKDYLVIAMARRQDELDKLKSDGVIPVVFDVTNTDDIKSTLSALVAEHGKINHLIYCAGVQDIKLARMHKLPAVRELFEINYFAAIAFSAAFLSKPICNSDDASITFISSIAADRPKPGIANYSASKAALEAYAKSLAQEAAPVRVNSVRPGFLKTEMTEKQKAVYTEKFITDTDEETPLGIAAVDDVAGTLRFLISGESAKITGITLTVDGGGALL